MIAWLIAVYAFLYAPIAFLLVFSFNDSRLVTSWTGFSTRWYDALWHDPVLIDAALLSLRIAAVSATLATLAGAAAGFALARFGRFRGKGLMEALAAAPLVLPDVMTGLALLLLFVTLGESIGWPMERGAGTVTLAHASVAMAYVTIIVRSRLSETGTALEEAAADLNAPPWTVFRRVTLPLMIPALVSGWLLAFTLSMDDLVVASFTSGPGASTLPMVVFSATRLGATPKIYALASLIAGIAGLGIGGLLLARRRTGHQSAPRLGQ
jgi:putrescine transport system permease protein